MAEKERKNINLTSEQSRYANDIVGNIEYARAKSTPVIRIISSSPGSGKTTLIIETLKKLVEDKVSIINTMIDNEEKILILAFSKRDKKDIEKAIKTAQLPSSLFEVSTVNSLFFRSLRNVTDTKIIGSFKLNYTKKNFSKKDIDEILSTFIRGYRHTSQQFENKINKHRIFSAELKTNKNIEALWRLVNGYFASSYKISDIENIEKEASFFGKGSASYEDFVFPDKDMDILKKILKKEKINNKNATLYLLKMVIVRIHDLANFQEVETVKYKTEKKIHIPIVIEDEAGREELISEIDESITKIKEEKHNIFAVPHSYYLKTLLEKMLSNVELTSKIYRQYSHIIVDESQDNTLSLLKTVFFLLKNKIVTDISLIGDSLQRIYAFSSSDNFDLLGYCRQQRNQIEQQGINVEEYSLNKTHRFGQEIATFVNTVFDDSNIVGEDSAEDFVFPESIKKETLAETVQKLTQKHSIALICRSNEVAMDTYVKLQESGIKNTRIETSGKQEITDFVKKGPAALAEKKHEEILSEILNKFDQENPYFVPKNKDLALYEKIISSREAVNFLRGFGYHNLVKYNIDEIEKYIIPAQRSRKNVAWIGTPYSFKGAEYDFVILLDDFFKNIFYSNDQTNGIGADIEHYEKTYLDKKHDQDTVKSKSTLSKILISNRIADKEAQSKITQEEEKEAREDEVIETCEIDFDLDTFKRKMKESQQEEAVLFVALTRGRKGVFMLDSPLSRVLKKALSKQSVQIGLKRGGDVLNSKDNFEHISTKMNQDKKSEQDLFSYSVKIS